MFKVTEKEIFNGIIKAKNPNNNVLYFEREIENIEEKIGANPDLARRFIDLDANNQVDKSAKYFLENLKKEKIRSKIADSNIFKFKVQWDAEHGISLQTHRDYIEDFGNTFFNQVKNLIDRNQTSDSKTEEMNEADGDLIREVLDHARFCKEKVSQFHGRNDLLNKMQAYLLDESNNSPFVIFGESGCGKTAILAKLADQVTFKENFIFGKFLIWKQKD